MIRRLLDRAGVTPRAAVVLVVAYAVLLREVLRVLRAHWIHTMATVGEEAPIQWVETLFMRDGAQIATGGPLYPEPTLAYVSTIYSPGMHWVHGALLALFGPSYTPLRAACAVTFALLCALAGAWTWRATRSIAWGVAASVLVLQLSEPLNYWFTGVNVDGMWHLLAFSGVFALYGWGDTRRGIVVGAALLGAAFLCKTPAFVLAATSFAWVLLFQRRHALLFAAVCAGVAGIPCLILLATSHGWMWTYLYKVPLSYIKKTDPQYLRKMFQLSWFATTCFFAAGPVLAWLVVEGGPRRREAALLATTWVGSTFLTWEAWGKSGGGENSLFAVFLLGTVLFALLPALVLADVGRVAVRCAQIGIAVIILAYGFDRTSKLIDVMNEVKSYEKVGDRLYGGRRGFEKRVLDEVKAFPGEVYIGARADVAMKLGKKLTTHQTPLLEVTNRSKLYDAEKLFGPELARKPYDAMVIWTYEDRVLETLASRYYVKVKDIGIDPSIGLKVALWTPIPDAPPPAPSPPPAP